MSSFDFTEHSHKRFNPLNNSWVLCSPHRAKRPWFGQQEKNTQEQAPSYVPDCYLCPGNKRVGGELNPAYEATFTFQNDFPAPDYNQDQALAAPAHLKDRMERLFNAQGVKGCARVICFSPKHHLTMAEMSRDEILPIIKEWIRQVNDLKALAYVNYGAIMGCSNPHPHGQVWATEDIPQEPFAELESLKKYRDEHHSCLLCDLVAIEQELGTRVVAENDSWLCLVPFWAVWPFETLVLPKSHVNAVTRLSEKQQLDLAAILQNITCRYDNLFETSFPYSMGLHGTPLHKEDDETMHLHIHFYPPLLRSATIKKFFVA
ncbi:galactose-1-phosphate uridyl transferase [Kappamyces sp. JEL0680]|nr:galactose-1-phosphate uridyl transferase [Kappamyces sp. JEL0680]